MSFLSEILVSKGLAEIEDLNEKIQRIQKCIVAFKQEVAVIMRDKHLNYLCANENSHRLQNQLKNLSSEIDDVTHRITDQISSGLSTSKDQLKSLSENLKIATLSYDIVNHLVKIDSALDAANQIDTDTNMLNVAERLKDAEEYLCNKSYGLEYPEIFEALKFELVSKQRQFFCNAAKLWDQCFVWNEFPMDNQTKTVTLTLTSNVNKEELIKTLHYYDMLFIKMRAFSKKLLSDILCQVINHVTVVEYEKSSVLLLKINLKEKKPHGTNVLNNLTIVFNFLSTHLNVKSKNVSFFSEMKKYISEEFCKYLTTNCLSLSVPKNREDLEAYKTFVENITVFERLIQDLGFLAEDNKSLCHYANNIEDLFVNKMCEAYLGTARNIMKKDLHEIKQVGPVDSSAPTDLEIKVHLTEISPYTFQFPLCQISKSTDELLELVNGILSEVPHSSDMCAVRLFYTARNIFSMYCDIVPEHHSRLLSTIPQQSAILHNNAMYLAHKLMILGAKHRDKMSQCLNGCTVTFVDLVDPLRCLASEVFTNHLILQKQQIIDTLRNLGLVTLTDSPRFPDGVEKAIRQCLRQLALLQSVWEHILPVNTYCKALGLLCNAFVEEIIQKVLMAEDIPADTTTHLVNVFALIQQKAPHVFPEPLEIYRHVKKWAKFCELQLLLGAGLREVDDRWADGKGPLAQEFTPDQVRHLVRALFQISERRAALIAKIV